MGERKVLNKYFPPDFDPSIMPRKSRSSMGSRGDKKRKQIEVRMMLPMSVQCDTCGEYMYRGKKFNSRKEDVLDETYFGIKIFRFYIKCVTCAAEITFKTDPKSGDYVAEKGASRNFEPWREKSDAIDVERQQRTEEEENDSMKTLENRTKESKREMEILDTLDEIKAINQRHERVDTAALLAHASAASAAASTTTSVNMTDKETQAAKRAFAEAQKSALAVPAVPAAITTLVKPSVKANTSTMASNITFQPKRKKAKTIKVSLVAAYSVSSSSSSEEQDS